MLSYGVTTRDVCEDRRFARTQTLAANAAAGRAVTPANQLRQTKGNIAGV